MSYFEAMAAARSRGLDLVEVAPNVVPPVCKIMDYGRYKYDQEKKDREARKSQKTGLMKEVRMNVAADDHDVETKTRSIQRFLEDGDKVKVTIQFRGAQMRHPEIGRVLVDSIVNRLKGIAVVERPVNFEGRNMSIMLGAIPQRGRQAPAPAAASAAATATPPVAVLPQAGRPPGLTR
jgi:translation initiation factor IF-3